MTSDAFCVRWRVALSHQHCPPLAYSRLLVPAPFGRLLASPKGLAQVQTLREGLKHGFHPHESPHGPAIKRQVRCKRARACELTAWSSFQFQLIFFGFVETFQRPAPPSVRRRRALWARCHHVLQHLVRDASTVNKGTRNSTLVFPLNPTPSTHGIRGYHSQLNGFPRPHPIDRGRRFQGLNAEKPTTTTPPHVGARVPAW